MPTQESWLDENTVSTVWTQPITPEELKSCFNQLARMIEGKKDTVHILFDIAEGGSVPAQAPMLALRSGFLGKPNLGRVAVVGMAVVPQILASVAASVSRKDIMFFPLRDSALAYLKDHTKN